MSAFDPRTLRLLVAAADLGSLSAAARCVPLTAPAASKRLADAEARAGCRLFERHARGLRPTPAGETFVAMARDLLERQQVLEAALDDFRGGVQGRLRVLANATSLAGPLPGDLGRFLRAHPTVRVDLREASSQEAVAALRNGDADLAVFDADLDHRGIDARPYFEDRLVVVVPDGHRHAQARSVAFAEVLDDDVVGLASGTAIVQRMTAHAEQAGRRLRMRMRVSSFASVLRMVAEGAGVAVLPSHAVAIDAPGVRAVPLSDPWSRRRHRLGCTASPLSPGARDAFLASLAPAGPSPPRHAG